MSPLEVKPTTMSIENKQIEKYNKKIRRYIKNCLMGKYGPECFKNLFDNLYAGIYKTKDCHNEAYKNGKLPHISVEKLRIKISNKKGN